MVEMPVAQRSPIPLVIISDPGEDLDDEMAMVMLRYLTGKGYVDCKGIVANLRPAQDRGRLLRGTLDVLGLYEVPVGIGTDGGSSEHKATFLETAASYMPADGSERARLHGGRALLRRCFEEATDGSLTLVCISSMKDAALFIRDNTDLFKRKSRSVLIMGGVREMPTAGGADGAGAGSRLLPDALLPDTANNNTFDQQAADYLYAVCQDLGVQLTVQTRHSAYACPVPREIYDAMAKTGSPIAVRLRTAQRTSIENLWKRCIAPEPDCRFGLPARCDRTWFQNTFCAQREVLAHAVAM